MRPTGASPEYRMGRDRRMTLSVHTGRVEAAAVVVATPVYDPERRRVRG
ncbi:MAG: hypothetical protein V9F00_18250 [Nocardioides sp.]